MIQPCANPRCHDYGQHLADACRDGCRGCAPRPATIGNLCRTCTDGIGRDARAAAVLHAELEIDLVSTGSSGGGSGNPFPTLAFDPRTAEARATIAHTLASWVKLVAEESGYALPEIGWRILPVGPGLEGPAMRLRIIDTGLDYLAAWLDLHRAWIAAHGAAGDACDELAALVHHGRRRQDHHRPGIVHEIGACPTCGAAVTAIVRRDDPTPTEAVCAGDQPHRWAGERQLAELGRRVGTRDGWMTAQDVARRYSKPLGTVRRWATSWRKTEDGERPVLYHPEDIQATVTHMEAVAAAGKAAA